MDLVGAELFGEEGVARGGIGALKQAGRAGRIDPTVDEEWGAGEGAELIVAPEFGFFTEDHGLRAGGILGGNLEGDEATLRGRVDVFFAVDGDEFAGTGEEDVGVEAAVRELEAPDGFAGAGVDAGDVAAAGADIEDAMAAEIAEDWRAHGIVNRVGARRAGPDEHAGAFFERVVAVAGRAVRSPVGGDGFRVQEIPIRDERSGAAVRKREAAEFFHHRALPDDFSVGCK